MRKCTIAIVVALLLAVLCTPIFAAQNGQQAVAGIQGYNNVPFKIDNDSYLGFCVDLDLEPANKGNTFTVQPLTNLKNNKTGEPVAEYLKILFVDYFDDVFVLNDGNYDIPGGSGTTQAAYVSSWIYAFTDKSEADRNESDYGPIQGVIAKQKEYAQKGKVIPDKGATVKKVYDIGDDKIHEVNTITFDFIALKSSDPAVQDFFAYKKDEEKSKEDHNYGDWEVTKEPTELEPGEKERVCEDCDHKDIEVLPLISSEPEPEDPTDTTDPTDSTEQTGPTDTTDPTVPTEESTEQPTEPIDSAKTGDDTNVTMWFILMALAGIAGTVIYRKRSDA